MRDPRHVEIQVIADQHGNVAHLGERECSIQRRHQKIMEETPSPAVTPEIRERMGEAAVRAVRAAGYVNAGTVEFIFSRGEFYFLEVNARLQVEHPISEEVTGIDLVKEQIRVASGLPLSFSQEEVSWTGHSIEMRINTLSDQPGAAAHCGRPVARPRSTRRRVRNEPVPTAPRLFRGGRRDGRRGSPRRRRGGLCAHSLEARPTDPANHFRLAAIAPGSARGSARFRRR